MDDQRRLKILMRFGLPAVVLIFYVTVAAHFAYTPDDTYIYLQFAKNVVRGDGFSFNPGNPTYGFTSPLWLLLVSAGGWMGIDLYIAAKALDLVLASVSLVLVFLLSLETIGDFIVALCTTLALSVNIWFLRWAGSGMESSLAVFLLLLALRQCLKNEYLLSIVFSALLTLVRPEAWLLTLLILIDVYVNSLNRRRAVHVVAALALLYAAFLAPWMIYARITFGTVVPNTALAKTSLDFHIDDFAWTLADLGKTLAVSDGVPIAVIAASLLLVLKHRKSLVLFGAASQDPPLDIITHARWLRFHFVPLAWIVALPALYIVTGTNVISRYLLLMVPVIVVYGFVLLWRVSEILNLASYRYLLAAGLTTLVLAQNQFIYYRHVRPSIEAFAQGMEECFIPIGKWLRFNTPDDAVVFVPDIGAIGYYSDRTICDAAGLVSPELLSFVRRGDSLEKMIDEGVHRAVCNATYIVYKSTDRGGLQRAGLDSLFSKVVFGLGLSDPRTVYYTVYRAGNVPVPPEKNREFQ